MKVLCVKDLFKSTYKELAFKEGKEYEVDSEDSEFFFIKDEVEHLFNFAKVSKEDNIYYLVDDYFNMAR